MRSTEVEASENSALWTPDKSASTNLLPSRKKNTHLCIRQLGTGYTQPAQPSCTRHRMWSTNTLFQMQSMADDRSVNKKAISICIQQRHPSITPVAASVYRAAQITGKSVCGDAQALRAARDALPIPSACVSAGRRSVRCRPGKSGEYPTQGEPGVEFLTKSR